jgi:uncharacterized protein YfiM (DUF2279 family)
MKQFLQKIDIWLVILLPSWVAVDKFKHFAVCFLGALIEGWVPAFTLGAALGKEAGDYFNPQSKWDWLDIVADVAGIIAGLTVRQIIKYVLTIV